MALYSKTFILSILVSLFVSACIYLTLNLGSQTAVVELELRATQANKIDLFPDVGDVFRPRDLTSIRIKPGDAFHSYKFTIPYKDIRLLLFHSDISSGVIEIKRIRIYRTGFEEKREIALAALTDIDYKPQPDFTGDGLRVSKKGSKDAVWVFKPKASVFPKKKRQLRNLRNILILIGVTLAALHLLLVRKFQERKWVRSLLNERFQLYFYLLLLLNSILKYPLYGKAGFVLHVMQVIIFWGAIVGFLRLLLKKKLPETPGLLRNYFGPDNGGAKAFAASTPARLFFFGLLPLVFYFAFFALYSYPLITHFSTHYYLDQGDGFQNVWTIWWVNYALTELSTNPWYTTYLHAPDGVTLFGATMNPFNGLVCMVLIKFMSMTQAVNSVIIFGFVAGGLSAFWLGYYLSRSYMGSLVCGFIFTFSNFHFAHAEGHMNFVSLEWLPLFVMSWLIFLQGPTIKKAILASLSLLLVLATCYYYFMYCVFFGVISLAWLAFSRKDLTFIFKPEFYVPLLIFLATTLVTSGLHVFNIIYVQLTDGFIGSHFAIRQSVDLLGPFIYGPHSYFGGLTDSFWVRKNPHETSVHFGFSVILLAFLGWFFHRVKNSSLNFWGILALVFMALSMGPTLLILSKETFIKMPYSHLQFVFPLLKMSGVPARMIILSILGTAVLAAFAVRYMLSQKSKGLQFSLGLLLIFMVIELIPSPLPLSRIEIPLHYQAINARTDKGIVLDTFDLGKARSLYFQTIHQKPIAFGYIARIPNSVGKKEVQLKKLIKNEDYASIRKLFKVKYIITGKAINTGRRIFAEDGKFVYDLEGHK